MEAACKQKELGVIGRGPCSCMGAHKRLPITAFGLWLFVPAWPKAVAVLGRCTRIASVLWVGEYAPQTFWMFWCKIPHSVDCRDGKLFKTINQNLLCKHATFFRNTVVLRKLLIGATNLHNAIFRFFWWSRVLYIVLLLFNFLEKKWLTLVYGTVFDCKLKLRSIFGFPHRHDEFVFRISMIIHPKICFQS